MPPPSDTPSGGPRELAVAAGEAHPVSQARSIRLVDGRSSPLLHLGIAVATAAVFALESMTPLGYAEWILYLVPLSLALFTWRPSTPVILVAVITVLMFIGFVLSPTGVDPTVARINRGLGLLLVWIVGGVTYGFVMSKLRVATSDWLRDSEATIARSLEGDQQLDELGQNALAELCQTVTAPVGVMYFADDQGQLRRFASYGVADGSVGAPLDVRPGEGVIGEAVRTRRMRRLQGLDAGHLPVQTALGRTATAEVVIVPAVADNAVEAVIELGFLRRPQDSDIELVTETAERIAVAVRTAKFRTQLQTLLEETQRQAEELQAQQEELRVSNEELEEQSNALKESQARLEAQQAELEETNAQLEHQAETLEEQKAALLNAQTDLRNRADELARANQVKSEFLANMSHELRTPLNSSLILAKLLADNPNENLTEEQVTFAQTIHAAGNDLLALINDILDLSKIEAGKVELNVESISLRALVEQLARTFKPLANDKGIAFESALSPGLVDTIATDGQRLQQVLKNLLANALKFTDAGRVSLTVEAAGPEDVRFIVEDTGIGIEPEHQETIFEAFRQADGSTHRKYGGTGLGLSIARELAHLLHGEIELSSTFGQGSTFTLTVARTLLADGSDAAQTSDAPARQAPPPPEARQPTPRASTASSAQRPPPRTATPAATATGSFHSIVPDDRDALTPGARTILIIEDDPTFARILVDLGRERGFKMIAVGSADEGVIAAQAIKPVGVLLDMNLPDHSGLVVLDRLKRSTKTRHIPVHILSIDDHAQTALELGAVGYAFKPVDREQIEAAISRLETVLSQRMRRVLVVEDDERQRQAIAALLGGRDVSIEPAPTAGAALEALRARTYDCMVMDLSLPDFSGYELLERMMADDTASHPPVIVYTGRSLTGEEEQRLRRYSRSIIVKGARSPERLLDEVSLFLHSVESELPADRQRMLREARNREAVFEGRKILVAEDDVRNVFALTSILEPKGASVVIARNGREAVEALQNGHGIDLVIMDIMMPEMDGLTAMRAIRENPALKKLPIVALTAKAMKDDQQRCLEAGANDYMAKPVDVEKLLSLLRVWMPKR